jgi:iron(III) transport system substrate-binding protein
MPPGQTFNKLVAGEISIYLNTLVGSTENARIAGNPVDWVRMSDNTYLGVFGRYGISANAPHPNAARLWIDFVFSKEGQQTLANAGQIANMPGIRVSNPDLAIQGKKLIQLERVSDAERADFLKAFSAKYGLQFP